MKLFLTVILFYSGSAFAQKVDSTKISQKQVDKVIFEITNLIRKKSIYKDDLNWTELAAELSAISPSVMYVEDCRTIYNLFSEKLRKAGDNHSFFWTKMDVNKVSSSSTSLPPENNILGKYLGDNVGYIKVPACLVTTDVAAVNFANSIRSHIKEVDINNQVDSWVVDLRQNTGGNMWPILAGLNALTEDGIVGYFVLPNENRELKWLSRNGEMMHSKATIDNYKIENLNGKIAILLDSMTGSSGEMTAVSFSGLNNVKFFGVPSWGATTANYTHDLLLGAQLYLAESYIADRNHKKFLGKIIPETVIQISEKEKDAALETAKNWLYQ